MQLSRDIESNIAALRGDSHESLLKQLAYTTAVLVDISQAMKAVVQNCELGETAQNPSIIRDVHRRLRSFEERSNKLHSLEEDFADDMHMLHERFPQLSRPETRTAVFLRLGFSTKQIAELSFSSKRTVDTHRTSIRKKLGVTEKYCLTRFFQNSFEGKCDSICVNSAYCRIRGVEPER